MHFQFYSQSVRENKAASHVLQTVWAYKDLRHTLTKGGWNKSHFKVSLTLAVKHSFIFETKPHRKPSVESQSVNSERQIIQFGL